MQGLNLTASRPRSAAYFFRLTLVKVPTFSPTQTENSLSWYSQNLPCWLAHSEASAAQWDSLVRPWSTTGKYLYVNEILLVVTYCVSIWRPAPIAKSLQFGH